MPRWLVPLAIAVPVVVGAWLFLRGTNTPSGVTASSPTDWNAGAKPQPPAAPIEDRARTLVPSVPPTTPHEPAEAASEPGEPQPSLDERRRPVHDKARQAMDDMLGGENLPGEETE